MKHYKHRLVGILSIVLIATASFQTFAQSQPTMSSKARSDYQKADKELNIIYQTILREYSKKTEFIKKLKVAQRLWVQLRNAESATKYPQRGSYGSAGAMCEALYLESLTRDRIKFLQVWLTGIPEGDVCNGSVKIKSST